MVGFVLRILQLRFGLNAAGVQLRHAGLGGIKALLPPIYFACNLINAAFPRFAFAFDLIMRRAFGQHRQARSLDCRFRAFNPRAHCREVFKGFLPRLSFNQLPLGTCGFLAMAADGLGQCLKTTRQNIALCFGARQEAAGFGHRTIGVTARLAGSFICLACSNEAC